TPRSTRRSHPRCSCMSTWCGTRRGHRSAWRPTRARTSAGTSPERGVIREIPPPARIPLLVLALLSLLTGVFAGLARLGVAVPEFGAAQAGSHAALMIGAFFGTVISLERAVALGSPWSYLAPAAAGTGGVVLLAGGPLAAAQWAMLAGAAVLVLASLRVTQRQLALFTVMLAIG